MVRLDTSCATALALLRLCIMSAIASVSSGNGGRGAIRMRIGTSDACSRHIADCPAP